MSGQRKWREEYRRRRDPEIFYIQEAAPGAVGAEADEEYPMRGMAPLVEPAICQHWSDRAYVKHCPFTGANIRPRDNVNS